MAQSLGTPAAIAKHRSLAALFRRRSNHGISAVVEIKLIPLETYVMTLYHCLSFRAAVLLTLGCCLAGCSEKPFPLAKASGICNCEGQPMSGGLLILSPIHDPATHGDKRLVGKPAQGLIQPDGTFVLSTYGTNDGAVIGRHSVYLNLGVLDDDDPEPPCKFAPENLVIEITPGNNQLEINLTKAIPQQRR